MIKIIITVLAICLLIKAIGLAFKITWSATKIIASILLALAIPLVIAWLIFIL